MTRFASIILLTLVTITTPLQVQAAQQSPVFLQLAQNQQHGLDAAVKRIKEKTGGRILSAKTVSKKGKSIHHIKVLLPSGKVRVYKVNAQ
jgi:hypothetical protein